MGQPLGFAHVFTSRSRLVKITVRHRRLQRLEVLARIDLVHV
jgi:hypothetical protein